MQEAGWGTGDGWKDKLWLPVQHVIDIRVFFICCASYGTYHSQHPPSVGKMWDIVSSDIYCLVLLPLEILQTSIGFDHRWYTGGNIIWILCYTDMMTRACLVLCMAGSMKMKTILNSVWIFIWVIMHKGLISRHSMFQKYIHVELYRLDSPTYQPKVLFFGNLVIRHNNIGL